MPSSLLNLVGIFTRGLGLRITLSLLPPIGLAWMFYGLYLWELAGHDAERLWWVASLGLIAILAGSAVVVWLTLSTVPPFRRIIDVTATLARGELAIEIPYRDRTGETGELARALEVFKQHVVQLAGVAAINAEKEGDLLKRRELMSLAGALEGEVEGTVKGVMVQAEAMNKSTAEAAKAIRRMESLHQTLTVASVETRGGINAVAAATDQLSSASREIATQMARTIGITGEAVNQAETANATMRQLAQVSAQVGDVLSIINTIAAQTNLLALNATIEAARAGDAGKGFAVVAGEVKALAGQTAKAVSTIAEQMEGIRVATGNGVKAMEAVGRTIDEVNSVAGAVAAAVEQQEASIREISSSAQRAVQQAETVSRDAAGISTEVGAINSLAGQVEKGAAEVSLTLGAMERRLSGILVNTIRPDQQGALQSGQSLTGFAVVNGHRQSCGIADMEIERARLPGLHVAVGTVLDVTLTGFGPLPAVVRESDRTGATVEFTLDSVTTARLGDFLFGATAVDQPYIKLAKAAARRVEQAFDAALARGEITADDLFDRDYVPIPGTDPQQFTTRFLALADKILPSIQEELPKADPKVMFGLAVNQDGYVSAHQVYCSKPQGPDPVWNAANCRNRRLFNNHTELIAVTHTQDHLLQTYIRDMGGGQIMLLKDASVPITVRGRHWGGLRLGYKL
jgi:methyl-accepting chemotaxis protein